MARDYTVQKKKDIDFDVYEKQDPSSVVNWGAEAKKITDTMQKVVDEREAKKAAITKSFQDQQIELQDIGEYENQDIQQMVMNGGQDVANKALDIQNLVERGLMKPSDATMWQHNASKGFKQVKNNASNFDKVFSEYTKRTQEGTNSEVERDIAQSIEGFANMNNMVIQADAESGELMMLRTDPNTGAVIPGESMSVNRMSLLMKQRIDAFDSNAAAADMATTIGTLVNAELKTQGVRVEDWETERSRVEDELLKGEDRVATQEDVDAGLATEVGETIQGRSEVLTLKANEMLGGPESYKRFTMMREKMFTPNGTRYETDLGGEKHEQWLKDNPNEDPANNPYIKMKFGGDGLWTPDLTEEQIANSTTYAEDLILSSLNRKRTVDVEKIQATPAPQKSATTIGYEKDREQNFSYVDQAAKIATGTQQEFQEGVATLSESYNNSEKGKKNPLAPNPVDRNSDPNFILITYESGEVKKIPRYQLDSDGNPVLDDDGNKIRRDPQQQNAEILSYMSPVEGSTDQIYKEYMKENPGGIKDYGGSGEEVKFLGEGETQITDTDLTNYPVLIDGKAGQLSDKFLDISKTESDDEVVLDLYKGEIDAILNKTFKGLDTTFEVEVDDIVTGYGHRNKIYVTIDGVKTTIDFDTKDESSKLLSELQTAINAAKQKIRDKRAGDKKKKEEEQKKKQDDIKKNKKPNVG